MLSIDKHCEMLTAHIRDRNASITDAFKLYAQMYSAIVGGTVVLRLQYKDAIPRAFASLSDLLVALVLIVCAVIILENLRSWFQLRKVLSKTAGHHGNGSLIIPMPKLWSANKIEALMLLVMVVSWGVFCVFNPLNVEILRQGQHELVARSPAETSLGGNKLQK